MNFPKVSTDIILDKLSISEFECSLKKKAALCSVKIECRVFWKETMQLEIWEISVSCWVNFTFLTPKKVVQGRAPPIQPHKYNNYPNRFP